MTKPQAILVIEDTPDWAATLAGIVKEEGYCVITCTTRDEAMEILTDPYQEIPVAVVDIRLDERDDDNEEGMLVLAEVQSRRLRTEIIIISGVGTMDRIHRAFDSSYWDKRPVVDFIDKRSDKLYQLFISAFKRGLRKYQLSNLEHSFDVRLSLDLEAGDPIHYRLEGSLIAAGRTKGHLELEIEQLAARANDIYDRYPEPLHREQAMRLGLEIHEQLFQYHKEISANFNLACGSAKEKRALHLAFETSRKLAGLPVEFLYDDQITNFLALHHPIFHTILGVVSRRKPISPEFVQELDRQGKKLRVLVICASAGNAEDEIAEIGRETKATLSEKEWIECHLLNGDDLSDKVISEVLKEKHYQIIHFIGHSGFSENEPGRSALFFDGPHGYQSVTADALRQLLENTDTRLVFLTSCEGTRTSSAAVLRSQDHLGLSDAIILAGVPCVIGYRWPVHAPRARIMAWAFYRSFIEHACPELALLDARCAVASENKDELAWLSPVMVMQK